MKASLVLLGLAAAVQATVPLCSAICVTNAIAATGCSASDTACICSSDKFFPTVAECAETDCDADETVLETANGFCERAGLKTEVKRWAPHGGPPFGRFRGGRWRRPGWKGGKFRGPPAWWFHGHKGAPAPAPAPAPETPSSPSTGGGFKGPGGRPWKGGPPPWWFQHDDSTPDTPDTPAPDSGSGGWSGPGKPWTGRPKPGGWSDWSGTYPPPPVNTVI